MYTSVFQIFKIGIGPSSSHTVGPMRASLEFLQKFYKMHPDKYPKIERIKVDLFGSLALTGVGHGTDLAVLLGLEGETPEHVNTKHSVKRVQEIKDSGLIHLWNNMTVPYIPKQTIVFNKMKRLPFHSNALTMTLYDISDAVLFQQTFYSVGGGDIQNNEDLNKKRVGKTKKVPFNFMLRT